MNSFSLAALNDMNKRACSIPKHYADEFPSNTIERLSMHPRLLSKIASKVILDFATLILSGSYCRGIRCLLLKCYEVVTMANVIFQYYISFQLLFIPVTLILISSMKMVLNIKPARYLIIWND